MGIYFLRLCVSPSTQENETGNATALIDSTLFAKWPDYARHKYAISFPNTVAFPPMGIAGSLGGSRINKLRFPSNTTRQEKCQVDKDHLPLYLSLSISLIALINEQMNEQINE